MKKAKNTEGVFDFQTLQLFIFSAIDLIFFDKKS
jgi:hypothetical protein